MSDSRISPRAAAPLALAMFAAFAACSSAFPLPPASLPTATVSVTLWALTGTSLANPSAYDIMLQLVARTDRTSAFDFAVDMRVDSLNDTSAVLLPRGALGLYKDGGLQVTQQPYDSITIAPTSGYQDSLPVAIKVGTVVLAASRSETCNFGYVRPLYSKMRITTVDLVARSITFDVLTDPNCGYRSLKADSLPPKE
jgi:hypothetical protein